MNNPAWAQPPSKQLCVRECGAQCCRAPGSIRLTMAEVQLLGAVKRPTTWSLVLRGEPHSGWQILNFSENGGQCPMLAWDNTCEIYADRPQACRHFPTQPDPRCAVWPA